EIGCKYKRYFFDTLIEYRASPLNRYRHQTFRNIRTVDNPNCSRVTGRRVQPLIRSWSDEEIGNVFAAASRLIAIEQSCNLTLKKAADPAHRTDRTPDQVQRQILRAQVRQWA